MEKILMIATYYPKSGHKKAFLKLWHELVESMSKEMGAFEFEMYEDTHTSEFIASGRWNSLAEAEKFLHSPELEKINKEMSKHLIQPTKHMNLLKEAA